MFLKSCRQKLKVKNQVNKKSITKAVIAAAGFGTRFLPQTKAMPKEMLPLIDKPIIQYIAEELVDAGIEDIIIVTGYHKRSIEDHFDELNADVRQNLEKSGKTDLLEQINSVSNLANFAYVRQKGPYGNATPLLNAEHLLGNEPFLYAFADDFVKASPSSFRQLLSVYEKFGGSTLMCIQAHSEEDYKKYGFVGGEQINDHLVDVTKIIEKPGTSKNAPSDFATVSGYVIDPGIFKYLHKKFEHLDSNEEFIMQDSMQKMIQDGYKIYGCKIENGKYYDAGNKLGYLKTMVDFALTRDDMKDEFRKYLEEIIN